MYKSKRKLRRDESVAQNNRKHIHKVGIGIQNRTTRNYNSTGIFRPNNVKSFYFSYDIYQQLNIIYAIAKKLPNFKDRKWRSDAKAIDVYRYLDSFIEEYLPKGSSYSFLKDDKCYVVNCPHDYNNNSFYIIPIKYIVLMFKDTNVEFHDIFIDFLTQLCHSTLMGDYSSDLGKMVIDGLISDSENMKECPEDYEESLENTENTIREYTTGLPAEYAKLFNRELNPDKVLNDILTYQPKNDIEETLKTLMKIGAEFFFLKESVLDFAEMPSEEDQENYEPYLNPQTYMGIGWDTEDLFFSNYAQYFNTAIQSGMSCYELVTKFYLSPKNIKIPKISNYITKLTNYICNFNEYIYGTFYPKETADNI